MSWSEVCRADLGALAIDDAQPSAAQVAPGRASDADHELEALARHDRGRHVPDVQLRRMRFDDETDLGRGLLLQGAVLVRRDNDGAIDVLSDDARRRQDDVVDSYASPSDFLSSVRASSASSWFRIETHGRQSHPGETRDADRQRDVGAGIHFVG